MVTPFKSGFLGAPTDETVYWFTNQVKEARTMCVPFTGSCKNISGMTHPEMTTESWDTQIISRAFIEGVFAAKEVESALEDRPRFTKGVIYETRSFQDIDERSAGFIDWMGANGTLFDKAVISSAAARSTFRGRMTEWNSTFDKFWANYQKMHKHHANYINMPGKFIHHEANFYETKPEESYDILFVDPPKVVTSSDAYSTTFDPINRALGGTVGFDRWVWRDYIGKMRNVLDVKSDVILFMYTSDVRPDLTTIKRVLTDYGKIVDESTFSHRSRFDYAIRIER